MHKVLKRALAVAIAVSVLSGCASEVDSIHMAPLPKVDNTFTPKTDWSRSVGDGVSGYYSKLTPVVGQGKIFVADRNGLVEALDPNNGKVLWKNDLKKTRALKFLEA